MSNNILEYKTAHGKDPEQLDEAVNKLIANGFEPHGSPYTDASDGSFDVWQAMVKYRAG
jgi:hypothetical protein